MKDVPARYKKSLLAILFIASIAGAAFFVSNRLSNTAGITPNAPGSKPLAKIPDEDREQGTDYKGNKLPEPQKPAPAAEPPSGGGGGGGRNRDDEEVESIVDVAATPVPAKTPKATLSKTPNPSPTNTPDPTITPPPTGSGLYGSDASGYIKDQTEEACGDKLGARAGTYCSGGKRFDIDLPATRNAAAAYADATKQKLANTTYKDMLATYGDQSAYDNCGADIECKKKILDAANQKFLVANNVITTNLKNELSHNASTFQVAGEISSLYVSDPEKFKKLYGSTGVLSSLGVKDEEIQKLTTTQQAYKKFYDVNITDTQLIKEICKDDKSGYCERSMQSNFNRGTYLSSIAGIDPTAAKQMGTDFKNSKVFNDKINTNLALYTSSLPDSQVAKVFCADQNDPRGCEREFQRNQLLNYLPPETKKELESDTKFAKLVATGDSPTIIKEFCNGNTACINEIKETENPIYEVTRRLADTGLQNVALNNRRDYLMEVISNHEAKLSTYSKSTGTYDGSYTGPTYKNSIINDAQQYNHKEQRAALVWAIENYKIDPKTVIPENPTTEDLKRLGITKAMLEYDKLVRADPTIVDKHYGTYLAQYKPVYDKATNSITSLSLDTGLFNSNTFNESNKVVTAKVVNYLQNAPIAGLTKNGQVVSWNDASEEYKTAARQKACATDKSLSELCSTGLNPPVGRPSSAEEAQKRIQQYEKSKLELEKIISADSKKYLTLVYDEKFGNAIAGMSTAFSNVASVDNPLTRALYGDLVDKAFKEGKADTSTYVPVGGRGGQKIVYGSQDEINAAANDYINRRLVETTYTYGAGIGGAIGTAFVAGTACGLIAAPTVVGAIPAAVACGVVSGVAAAIANIAPIWGDWSQAEINASMQKKADQIQNAANFVGWELTDEQAQTGAGFLQSAYSNQGAASYTADGYMLGGAVTRKDNNFALYNSINLTSAQQGTSLLNPYQDPNVAASYLTNIQVNRDFDKLAMTQNNLAVANLVVSAVTGGASGGIGAAIADDIIPPATLAKILASKFISNPQTIAVNVANSALNLAQATVETESTIDYIDTQPEIDLQKCLIGKGYENCTEQQKYVEETNTQIAKDQLATAFWTDTFINIGQETISGVIEYHKLNNPPPFAAISANPADIPNSSRAFTRAELEQRAIALGIEDPSRSNFGNKDALLANILKSEREIAKQFGVTPEQIRATPDQNIAAYANSHKNLTDKNIIISQIYGNGIVEFKNTQTGDVNISQKNAPDALIISNAKKQGVEVEGQSFKEVLADTKNRKALEPPPAANGKQKIGALFPTRTTDTELDNRANAIGLDTSNAKNRTEKWQMIIKREAEISKVTGLPVENIRALSNKDVNYYYDSAENLSNPKLVISSVDEETGYVKFKNVDKTEEFSVHPTSPEARRINAASSFGIDVVGKNFISVAGELADISRLPQRPPALGQPEKINTTTRLSREELNNRAIALGIDDAATNKKYSTREALWEKITSTEKKIADTLEIDPEIIRGTSNKNVKYYTLSSERISKGDIRMIGFTDEGNIIFENIFDGNRYVSHKDSPESRVVLQALDAGVDPGGLTHVQLKENLKIVRKDNYFYSPSEMSDNARQAEMFGVHPNTLNTKKRGLNSKQLEVVQQSAERINDKNLRVAGVDKSTNRVSFVKDILTPEGPKTAIVDSYDGLPDSTIVIEAQKRGISVFGRNIADIRNDLLNPPGFFTKIVRRLRGFDTSPFVKEDIVNKANIISDRVRIARLEEEFKQAKYIDSRTGLINRAGATAQLEAWSGSKNKPVVVEIGLTYLKDVNDISGDHRIGDSLIDTFSRILSKTAKDTMDEGEFGDALLTTQGGKKFNLVLRNNDQKLISTFLKNLNTNIELLQTTNPEHFTANSLSYDISRGTWNGKESALDLLVRVGESRSTKSEIVRKMYPAKKNLDLENIQFANNPLADRQMLLDTLGLPNRSSVTPEVYISEAKKIIKKFGLDIELTGDKTPLEIKRLAAEIPKKYIEKYNAFTPIELKKYASALLSEDIVDGFTRGDLPKIDDVIDSFVYGNRQQDMNNLLEIRKLEKGIENAKTRNSLTGLYNQAAGDLSLNMAIESAKRTGGSLSIINIDVSGLGNINEVMGLDAGDELLRIAGDIFDTVSRRGTDKVFKPADPNFAIGESPNGAIAVHPHGDEFAIILPGTDENGGNYVISRLKEELAARKAANPNNDILQALNFDAGVAQWRPGEDVFDFTKRAELKMYEDKIARKATEKAKPTPRQPIFQKVTDSATTSFVETSTKVKSFIDKVTTSLSLRGEVTLEKINKVLPKVQKVRNSDALSRINDSNLKVVNLYSNGAIEYSNGKKYYSNTEDVQIVKIAQSKKYKGKINVVGKTVKQILQEINAINNRPTSATSTTPRFSRTTPKAATLAPPTTIDTVATNVSTRIANTNKKVINFFTRGKGITVDPNITFWQSILTDLQDPAAIKRMITPKNSERGSVRIDWSTRSTKAILEGQKSSSANIITTNTKQKDPILIGRFTKKELDTILLSSSLEFDQDIEEMLAKPSYRSYEILKGLGVTDEGIANMGLAQMVYRYGDTNFVAERLGIKIDDANLNLIKMDFGEEGLVFWVRAFVNKWGDSIEVKDYINNKFKIAKLVIPEDVKYNISTAQIQTKNTEVRPFSIGSDTKLRSTPVFFEKLTKRINRLKNKVVLFKLRKEIKKSPHLQLYKDVYERAENGASTPSLQIEPGEGQTESEAVKYINNEEVGKFIDAKIVEDARLESSDPFKKKAIFALGESVAISLIYTVGNIYTEGELGEYFREIMNVDDWNISSKILQNRSVTEDQNQGVVIELQPGIEGGSFTIQDEDIYPDNDRSILAPPVVGQQIDRILMPTETNTIINSCIDFMKTTKDKDANIKDCFCSQTSNKCENIDENKTATALSDIYKNGGFNNNEQIIYVYGLDSLIKDPNIYHQCTINDTENVAENVANTRLYPNDILISPNGEMFITTGTSTNLVPNVFYVDQATGMISARPYEEKISSVLRSVNFRNYSDCWSQ